MYRGVILIFFFVWNSIYSQNNTVGVLQINESEVFEGYNLFTPHFQSNVFLMNNCGEIVHQWEDSIYKPSNTVYLQEDGSIIRCGTRGQIANPNFHAGGGGEMIEKKDWEGNLIWRYFINDSINRLHHDISVLPNNNILVIAWKKIFIDKLYLSGRDTSNLVSDEIWSEQILEIKPITKDSFEVVWEWQAWDHIIQDFDSTKNNFGVVKNHPELIDINFGNNLGFADWLHFNSIDYNEELDQILVSVPFFNEIWIIDHSTTSAEAAGGLGGNSNKGGDLIFRWGNPLAFQEGMLSDQKLFFQHDAHWLDNFISENDVDYGKIAVFNNRINSSYSSINLIDVSYDDINNIYPQNSNVFEPFGFDYTYVRPDTAKMYTRILAGWQKLENGNVLVCSGSQGNIFEINKNQEIVWEYENPMIFGNLITQGSMPVDGENMVFRLNRYDINFPAFENRNLEPNGFLELNPTPLCSDSATSIKELPEIILNFGPNPFSASLNIELNELLKKQIIIYDALGQQVYNSYINSTKININTSNWDKGVYFIKVGNLKDIQIVIKN